MSVTILNVNKGRELPEERAHDGCRSAHRLRAGNAIKDQTHSAAKAQTHFMTLSFIMNEVTRNEEGSIIIAATARPFNFEKTHALCFHKNQLKTISKQFMCSQVKEQKLLQHSQHYLIF